VLAISLFPDNESSPTLRYRPRLNSIPDEFKERILNYWEQLTNLFPLVLVLKLRQNIRVTNDVN